MGELHSLVSMMIEWLRKNWNPAIMGPVLMLQFFVLVVSFLNMVETIISSSYHEAQQVQAQRLRQEVSEIESEVVALKAAIKCTTTGL